MCEETRSVENGWGVLIEGLKQWRGRLNYYINALFIYIYIKEIISMGED